jgi:Ca2+-binding EF-hand superfamily protein
MTLTNNRLFFFPTVNTKVLIFPIFCFVELIKKTVSFSKQQMKSMTSTSLERAHSVLFQNLDHIAHIHLNENQKNFLHHWAEFFLLLPVKCVLLFFVWSRKYICLSKICTNIFSCFCCVKTDHLGGHQNMYDDLVKEGPCGFPMEKIIIINDSVRQLKFYEMRWNTNVLHPKSKTGYNEKKLVCQVIAVDPGGDADKQGFQVDDIIESISSSRGTFFVKPGSDSRSHAVFMLKHASKPMTFTVLREDNPKRKEEMKEKEQKMLKLWSFPSAAPSMKKIRKPKVELKLSHEQLELKSKAIFAAIDVNKRGWLTKDQTKIAYYKALGDKDIDDDEFEYEFIKMDKNGDDKITLNEFSKGFFRELMFAELDEDGDGRISKEEMKKCFQQYYLDFESVEHQEFEAMYDSMVLFGESDVSFESFKKHIFTSFKHKHKHKKKKKKNKKKKNKTHVAPADPSL